MRPFVSLHNHTTFSIGDSIITPADLFETAKSLNQSAIAVTDHGTASGLYDCLKLSKKTKVKLIAGIESYFVDSVENKDSAFKHLILLAKNAKGYKNLLTINKLGFDNFSIAFKKAVPRIDWKILENYSDGLICTTACGNGVIGQLIMKDNLDLAINTCKRLKDIFGDDFVLELQSNKLQRRSTAYSAQINQEKINMGLKKISEQLNIRAIVTTNAHYIKKDQAEIHDVLLCSGSGQAITSGNRLIYDKPDFYIKSADEVFETFERHLPIWGKDFVDSLFENTIYYADKCDEVPEWIHPSFVTGEKSQLPDFPYKDEPDYPEFLGWVEKNKEESSSASRAYKDGVSEDALFYRYRSEVGLYDRIAAGKIPEVDLSECYENMAEEFDVLEYRGFSSYMLISADFLNWARKKDILVGYGRGCLTGDAKVLTSNGYKDLKDVVVGDNVYTHTGLLKPVEKVFKYDVDEVGIEIKTNYAFNTIKLTKDHKVFAAKSVNDKPSWMKACDLRCGNYIWMPFTEKYKKTIEKNKFNQLVSLSLKKALELKEKLLNKGIPSSIEDNGNNKYNVLTFKGDFFNIKENGYYCKILELNPYKLKDVYDIQVADDHSYLTSNYAVHNSVGGFLTAYTNYIHGSYPKKYGLVSARFINKYKDAYPDIDNDISSSGRDQIHQYLKNKYGADNFCAVSNVNTMTPKPYVKAIARIFNFGDEDRKEAVRIGNAIADSISADCKNIKQALSECPVFAEFAKQYSELEKYSMLCGKPTAWSTHAAGVIISKNSLIGLVPLRRDTNGVLVVEYDKERAEENGLIKIDLLGLKTLDLIESARNIIKSVGKELIPFDPEMEDDKTYEMITNGDTGCVFQLAGSAVPVCKKIKPKSIDDISLINALVRPACKDIINDLVKIRNGEKAMELIHPVLKDAFGETYGYGIYEESLMKVGRIAWDMALTDRLRKLTKEKGKYPEKVAKWREDYIECAGKKGFDKEMAARIWDEIIQNFGSYSFNKSHSVLYSMLSFYTAFLKAHYPIEFLVANLMNESSSKALDSKDNIIKIKGELRARGIKIVTPNINKSERAYKIIDEQTIMAGLDSLKFMPSDSINEILAKRPFTSFKDLIYRSNVKGQAIAALAAAGGLDNFGIDRKLMFFYAADYRAKLKAHINKNINKNIRDWAKANKLKKIEENKVVKYINSNNIEQTIPVTTEEYRQKLADEFEYPFPKEADWTIQEKFALEEKYMGEGISGSDFDRYAGFFDKKTSLPYQYLSQMFPYVEYSQDEKENKKMNTHYLSEMRLKSLDGILTYVFNFKVKKEESKIFGQEMCRMGVRDAFGGQEMTLLCFPEAWIAFKERIVELCGPKQKIEPGLAVRFICSFQWDNEHTTTLILQDLLSVKLPPVPPKDLKSKKVKMPRVGKVEVEEIEEMEKDEIVEVIEEEAVEDGEVSIDDDIFNFNSEEEDQEDPFNRRSF